jgi:hypothetical protein
MNQFFQGVEGVRKKTRFCGRMAAKYGRSPKTAFWSGIAG